MSGASSLSRYSDEDRLNENDCEETEESANAVDNIPVNHDIYVIRDETDWMLHNSNVPGKLATRNVL
ncbi:hypothetical protein TNCV_693891 [Trichonephila clavipes]|nr:hypothetical protein TNCV_693891 [Trichonephila clavipes]